MGAYITPRQGISGYIARESQRVADADFGKGDQHTGKINSPTLPGRSAKSASKRSSLSRLLAAVAKRSGRTTSAPLS
jgi:hypothetical protein